MEKKKNYLFSNPSINKKEIKKLNNLDSSNFKTFFNKSSTIITTNRKLNNLKNLRNKTVLNHVKLNKELLKLENISGNDAYNSSKKNSILKKNNTTFLTSTSIYKINNHRILDSHKMPQNLSNNKILKELFPNIRELYLYSNIPLVPFNNDDKNSNVIKNGRTDLKKMIYKYYSKGGSINPSNFNVFSKYISDNINNKEVTKNKSQEKNSNLFHNNYLKHIKKKNILKLKMKNSLKSHKLTKLNSFISDKINKIFIVKKFDNLENDYLTLRNKDIKTKYNQFFPDINDSKNGSYYKSIKIPKNTTFSKEKNNFINNLYENDFENNKYSYSIKTDKIQSMILRNKLNSIEVANKEKYENHKYKDKATNTM